MSLDDGILGEWLDQQVGDTMPVQSAPLTGGGSCELFSVKRGSEHWVLRRAPLNASSTTAHNVLREFELLDKIKTTDVRIAQPIASCDDAQIAGGDFYLMDFVDGEPIRRTIPTAYENSAEEQSRALNDHVDVLADIHNVDWRSCGLDEFGTPEGFLERQIPRWTAQLDSYQCRDLPGVGEVSRWLEANLPNEQPAALFHGREPTCSWDGSHWGKLSCRFSAHPSGNRGAIRQGNGTRRISVGLVSRIRPVETRNRARGQLREAQKRRIR